MAVLTGLKGNQLSIKIGFYDKDAEKTSVTVTVDAEQATVLSVETLPDAKIGNVYYFDDGNRLSDFIVAEEAPAALATNTNPTAKFATGSTVNGTVSAVELFEICATSNQVNDGSNTWEEEATSCSEGGYPYSYAKVESGEIQLSFKKNNCDNLQVLLNQAMRNGDNIVLQYYDKTCKKYLTYVCGVTSCNWQADDMAGFYTTDLVLKPQGWAVEVQEAQS